MLILQVPSVAPSISQRRFFPAKSALQPEGLHRTRGVARSDFRPFLIFPTAATRRCMDRVSVPLWGATLSGPLPVIALVGHYLTN